MKNRLLIVLSLVLFTLTAGISAAVAQVYEEFEGHYYQVITEQKTWGAAYEDANRVVGIGGVPYQGHLAVITSADENAFVYGLLNTAASGYRGWIGGVQLPNQTNVSAGWYWVTFETMSYTNWDPTIVDTPIPAPNDAGGESSGDYTWGYPYYGKEDNGENCMEMRGLGYWDDRNCDTVILSYVIEFEPLIINLITDGGDNPTDIGNLHVSYNEGSFNIEYSIDSPWEIVETHVYIGNEPPSKSSPGLFPYTEGSIPFTIEEYPVFIAAHAEVRKQIGVDEYTTDPVYTYESVWAQDSLTDEPIGKGANWATYFEYVYYELP